MNLLLNGKELALYILKSLIEKGMQDVFLCPGSRNASFTFALEGLEELNCYTHYEERSCAFFALGNTKKTKKPAAVIVTSGTAAGELYPAVMEAYYSRMPLVLITADRPKRYRGTGAPQAAEQKGMFGSYAFALDIETISDFNLIGWDGISPLHLNVCLEDPNAKAKPFLEDNKKEGFQDFLKSTEFPLVIVGTLEKEKQAEAIDLLLQLNCPVILESSSNLREEEALQHLHIRGTAKLLQWAKKANYPVDAVIRIGGVPTLRFWRDLEELPIKVCSISKLPFTGSPKGFLLQEDLSSLLLKVEKSSLFFQKAKMWLQKDQAYQNRLQQLIIQEPKSSPAMLYQLSKILPDNSLLYLGNSLSIRDWDLAACIENKNFTVFASKGLNGIDGQLSTFFGLCSEVKENFAILGDLTALYDMAAPWMLPQMAGISVTVFVVNNQGGKIFSRLFKPAIFQNNHELNFKPFAEFWGMEYEVWEQVPDKLEKSCKNRLVEIRPCNLARDRLLDNLLTLD